MEYYKYFTLLLQEVNVDLEEAFLRALLGFFRARPPLSSYGPGFSMTTTTPSALSAQSQAIDEQQQVVTAEAWRSKSVIQCPSADLSADKMYFEVLQIQPMKWNISFSLDSSQQAAAADDAAESDDEFQYADLRNRHHRHRYRHRGGAVTTSYNPIAYFTNVLVNTVGNVSEAPIVLNALIMEHPIFTIPVLNDLIYKHYTQEITGQVHRIIGSADFLGNPVGLFNAIGSGVKDAFYEPYQGFVSDRPQDFGIGLAKGTASFLRKTVYGVSDTFSKFTGSVGKGLASATLDSDFQRDRMRSRNRNKPTYAVAGITTGASTFAKSLVSGVTGIIEQPIKGAEQEGVGGFFKGIGRGIVGAVTKPVVGVFDMASNVTEGIKNSAASFHGHILERSRLPRHIGRDGIIRPFNQREAAGAMLLTQVQDGAFYNDSYVAHLDVKINSIIAIIIVTDVRLLCVDAGKFLCEWIVPFPGISFNCFLLIIV
jgi:vacuolar protein sorting-associated protein 13A/C